MKSLTRFDYLLRFCTSAIELVRNMRKIYSYRPKKYNPVRVSNPIQSHSVRLLPRQSIRLVLSRPETIFSKVNADAKYEIILNSDFFYIESFEDYNSKDQLVYIIAQKYDLSQWAEHSQIFLGEIIVKLIDNTHEQADSCGYTGATIHVYHDALDNKSSILTVINPNNQTIKLEPHQTLELVCFEKDWQNNPIENWEVYIEDYEVESKGIFLERLNHYILQTDLFDLTDKIRVENKIVKPRYQPTLNPLLSSKDTAIISSKEDGRKPGKEWHFWFSFTKKSLEKIGSLLNGEYNVSKIKIRAVSPDKKVIEKSFFIKLNKHGKPIGNKMMDAIPVNKKLLERNYDKHRKIMTCPGNTEQLDFHPSFKECTIEIPIPKIYWESELDTERWMVETEEGTEANKNLTLEDLGILTKNSIPFQRFNIIKKDNGEFGFMGSIRVFYPKKPHLTDANKRLSIWMDKNISAIYKSNTQSNSKSYMQYQSHKSGVGYYNRPKLSHIVIEELIHASLADGAKTKKLKEISQYDYLEGYYSVPNNYKKKEESIVKPVITPTITQNIWESVDPIVLQNPVHCQEVTVVPNQELHLQLMQPENMFTGNDREKCRGELWTVNPMSIGEIKPIIVKHTISQNADDCYRQFVVIRIDNYKIPSNKGTYCMGAIRLECSAGNRVIQIYVRKDQTQEVGHLPEEIKFISNGKIPMHEANNRRYLLMNNWDHDSMVKIKESDILYITQPEMEGDWKDSEWSVQIVQHPIPLKIWDKLSQEVHKSIDRQLPWYSKDYPMFLQKTLMFKGLDQISKSMHLLLKEIGAIANVPYFPIATISFKTQKSQGEINKDGYMEMIVRNKKNIHLYVSLEEVKDTKVRPVYYPTDNMSLVVSSGEIIEFHLDNTPEKWRYTSWPSFMQEINSNVQNETACFKFLITKFHGNQTGYLTFKNDRKTIQINIKPKAD